MSCDLLPSERPGLHYVGDVRDVVGDGWDLMVAHPPCTYLALSGARWNQCRLVEQVDALAFVRFLLGAPIPRIALENPIGAIGVRIRPADQIVHPWQFGHGERKATCLWLRGLPRLVPTQVVPGRVPRVHFFPDVPARSRERSRTYSGLAQAMADQWGAVPFQRGLFDGA